MYKPFRNAFPMLKESFEQGFAFSVRNTLVAIPAGIGHIFDSLFNTRDHNVKSKTIDSPGGLTFPGYCLSYSSAHSGSISRVLVTPWADYAYKLGKLLHNVFKLVPAIFSGLDRLLGTYGRHKDTLYYFRFYGSSIYQGSLGRLVGYLFALAEKIVSLLITIPTALVTAFFTLVGDLIDGTYYYLGEAWNAVTGGSKSNVDLDALLDNKITQISVMTPNQDDYLTMQLFDNLGPFFMSLTYDFNIDVNDIDALYQNKSGETVENGIFKGTIEELEHDIKSTRAQQSDHGHRPNSPILTHFVPATGTRMDTVPATVTLVDLDRNFIECRADELKDKAKDIFFIRRIHFQDKNGEPLKTFDNMFKEPGSEDALTSALAWLASQQTNSHSHAL